MKCLALVFAVALVSQSCYGNKNYLRKLTRRGRVELNDCPIKDCGDIFWDKYSGDESGCAQYIQETDDCYKKLDGAICDCSLDEAYEAHAWKKFLKDIYNDRYCQQGSGCVSDEAKKCAESLLDADSVFFTVDSADDDTNNEGKPVIEAAINCVKNDMQNPLDVTGCGWDISTLRADRSMYVPLWEAWLGGCKVHNLVKNCIHYIKNFEETVCNDDQFKEFSQCFLGEISKYDKCPDLLPNNEQDLKDEIFAGVIADRCPVYDDVEACDNDDDDKRRSLEKIIELLKKMASKK